MSETPRTPTLHILAGPNGAGKSTLYEAEIKPRHPNVEFVNADKLALEHFGHHASTEAEAKKGQELADARRAALMAERKGFVTESTFSHPSKLDLITEARDLGYKVAVYHVNVRSAELSIARVSNRVENGGHAVPEDRIRGRYERNKALIKEAVVSADRGQVFDNSKMGQPPELAIKMERGQVTYVSQQVPAWAKELYAEQLERFSPSRLNPGAASFAEAKTIAAKLLGDEAKTFIARDGGTYRGEIIGQTSAHTLQQVGQKSVVAHFTSKLEKEPTLSSYATVQYAGQEKATVAERPARAAAFELSPESEAVKRFPELKPAYDLMRQFEADGRATGKITDDNSEHFRTALKAKLTASLDAGNVPKPMPKDLGTEPPALQQVGSDTPSKPAGLTQDQANAVIYNFTQEYPGIAGLKVLHRPTQEDFYGPNATVEKVGLIKGAFLPRQGHIHLALANFHNEGDCRKSLQHEALGHFATLTFTDSDKRALLEAISDARQSPSMKADWATVDSLYSDKRESLKAEEVYCLAAERIAGPPSKTADQVMQTWAEVVTNKTRPMAREDIQAIAEFVADGLRRNDREQKIFPADDRSQFAIAPAVELQASRQDEPAREARAVAFERLPQDQALAKHPELKGTYEHFERAIEIAKTEVPAADLAGLTQYMKSQLVEQLDRGEIIQSQEPQIEQEPDRER